jgi:hypothetical protein
VKQRVDDQDAAVLALYEQVSSLLLASREPVALGCAGSIQITVTDRPDLNLRIVLEPAYRPRLCRGNAGIPGLVIEGTAADIGALVGPDSNSSAISTHGDYDLWLELVRIIDAPEQKRRELLKGRPCIH